MGPLSQGRGGVSLSDELIICTLNRPREVERCLASVTRQTRLPDLVRVVDASENADTRSVVDRYAAGALSGRLIYQAATPGLTAQRNAGIRAGRPDIVHFVDDDTVLDSRYVESILREFLADPEGTVLGVGGMITNLHRHRVPIAKRAFMLDSPRTGRVLPSGRNPCVVDVQSVTEVDWLSGCSMSFRRGVFETFSFNEAFKGYGLGEDVEFSYRVRQRGRLLVAPEARIEHLQSPTNRMTMPRYTYDEIVNRARRVRARTGCLRMRWFWWSVIGQLLALAGASVLDRSAVQRARFRKGLAAAWTVLRDAIGSDDGDRFRAASRE
jgi:GT2 family glycosyltransferase